MIQVSVTSTEVRNQSGTAKATGKPYSMNFQTVWFHTFDRNGVKNPYPEKAEIILEKDAQGAALFYPVGEYTLAPQSVYVGRTGTPEIATRLVPLKAATLRPAAAEA